MEQPSKEDVLAHAAAPPVAAASCAPFLIQPYTAIHAAYRGQYREHSYPIFSRLPQEHLVYD